MVSNNSPQGDQVILKHINEAIQMINTVNLDQLEIELRLNKHLTKDDFERLERKLAQANWEATNDTCTTDKMIGEARVTDQAHAIRKRRISTTDLGTFRVVTSHEQPIPLPPDTGCSLTRVKQRRERCFWGWKLSLTVINPQSKSPGYECEVELDASYLVRRPHNLLAKVGAGLMGDVVALQ